MSDLKPCPCGSESLIEYAGSTTPYAVVCLYPESNAKCVKLSPLQITYATKQEAINAWNKRK